MTSSHRIKRNNLWYPPTLKNERIISASSFLFLTRYLLTTADFIFLSQLLHLKYKIKTRILPHATVYDQIYSTSNKDGFYSEGISGARTNPRLSLLLVNKVNIFSPLETEAGPAGGIPAELSTIGQGLGQGLAGSLGQEECGQSSDSGAETEYEERQDRGDFSLSDSLHGCWDLGQGYQVHHGRGKEDRESANNFAKCDSLSSYYSWEDLTAVLETDEVGSIDHHSPDQTDTKDGERPLGRDEPVHDSSQPGSSKKYQ